jgi:MscS family membrane protein
MIETLFSTFYFENSVFNWLLFFLTIIGFIILSKLIGFSLRELEKNFLKKENSLNLLLKLLEEPIMFSLIIFSIFIGYQFLVFDEIVNFYFYNVLTLLIIFIVVWLLMRLIDNLLEKFLRPIVHTSKTKYDDQLISLIGKLLKVLIIIFAIIVILDNFGFDVFTLLAGLGIGGLAFAFAAQKTIADAFGGLSIIMSKPFILGDVIEFDNNLGTVEEINLRHTRIRNLDKRIVIIPNSNIANSVVTNISSGTKRKIIWKIGITYNTPVKKIEKAKKIIINSIESSNYCEKEPTVAFEEFANYSLNILVIFFTKTNAWSDMVKAKDEVGLKIKKEFEKNKIDFAFPTQTIYLEK